MRECPIEKIFTKKKTTTTTKTCFTIIIMEILPVERPSLNNANCYSIVKNLGRVFFYIFFLPRRDDNFFLCVNLDYQLLYLQSSEIRIFNKPLLHEKKRNKENRKKLTTTTVYINQIRMSLTQISKDEHATENIVITCIMY